MLGLRPPGLEFRNLCLEDSVISIISQFSLYVHKGGIKPDSFHFPELRGPALVYLSAIDKKFSVLVQYIIKGRTKESSSNISSTCIPSTNIASADQHLFNTCLRCTPYREDVGGPTHQIPVQYWASISAHCWLNVG